MYSQILQETFCHIMLRTGLAMARTYEVNKLSPSSCVQTRAWRIPGASTS